MDMNEVATLLHIAEKTIQWPKLKPIHDEAMDMLHRHAEEAEKNAQARKPTEPPQVLKPDPEPEDDQEPDDEPTDEPEEEHVARRAP